MSLSSSFESTAAEADEDTKSTKDVTIYDSDLSSSSSLSNGRYNGNAISSATMEPKVQNVGGLDTAISRSVSILPAVDYKFSSRDETPEQQIEETPDGVDVKADTEANEEEVIEAPPLAGVNVMNVIVVAAECAPWSKTGRSHHTNIGQFSCLFRV